MGSCICKYVEMNKTEFAIHSGSACTSKEALEFSSSSEEFYEPDIENWQNFKSRNCRSFNESTALLSTLLQSERKISVYSKPGSFHSNFAVGYPKIVITNKP